MSSPQYRYGDVHQFYKITDTMICGVQTMKIFWSQHFVADQNNAKLKISLIFSVDLGAEGTQQYLP